MNSTLNRFALIIHLDITDQAYYQKEQYLKDVATQFGGKVVIQCIAPPERQKELNASLRRALDQVHDVEQQALEIEANIEPTMGPQ